MLIEQEESYYMQKLADLKETGQNYLVISGKHLHEFDPKLYLYLIKYPPEIIITFDDILTDVFYN